MATIQAQDDKNAIAQALGPAVVQAPAVWAQKVYPSEGNPDASTAEIETYLKNSSCYNWDAKKWTSLHRFSKRKRKNKREADLYPLWRNIFTEILRRFGSARNVWDPHNAQVNRSERPIPELRFPPDIVTSSRHPISPYHGNVTGCSRHYDQVINAVDIKLNHDIGRLHIGQMGLFTTWQINNAQPGRNFQRCLVVSEANVVLLHYDRSGVRYSLPFNVHDRPVEFVHLFLGITSMDPKRVGLDSSIAWSLGPDEKTVSGKLTTCGADGKTHVTYDIIGPGPLSHSGALTGRGTTCWSVKAENGENLVVKDSWRAEDRVPEYTLLERAIGVEGVAQMVAYEDLETTTELRGPRFEGDVSLSSRTKSRITLQNHGSRLEEFKSVAEVLCALHDAIKGHKNLLETKNILHRDISMNNILIGREGSAVGWRGVLIDLAMAIQMDRPYLCTDSDFRTGTRSYLSINLLGSQHPATVRRQNYLDDLESFYYVLLDLVLKYERVGKVKPHPSEVERWGESDRETARAAKITFFAMDYEWIFETIDVAFWGEPCIKLLTSLRDFFYPLIVTRPSETELQGEIDRHYAQVLSYFQTAIDETNAGDPLAPVERPRTPEPHPAERPDRATAGIAHPMSPEHLLPPLPLRAP